MADYTATGPIAVPIVEMAQVEHPILIENLQFESVYSYANKNNPIERRPVQPSEVWFEFDLIPAVPPPQTPFPGTPDGGNVVSGISDVALTQVPGDPTSFQSLLGQFSLMVPAVAQNNAYHPTLRDSKNNVVPYDPTVWIADSLLGVVNFTFGVPEDVTPPFTLAYWRYIGPILATTGALANEGGGAGEVFDSVVAGVSNLRTFDPDPAAGSEGISVTTSGQKVLIGNTLTGTNLSAVGGVDVFSSKNAATLEFRQLVAGSGVTVTQSSNAITISAGSSTPLTFINEGGGAGQVFDTIVATTVFLRTIDLDPTAGNEGIVVATVGGLITVGNTMTGSNVGAGAQVFKTKTAGAVLQFRSLIVAASSGLTLTQNANDITVSATVGAVVTALANEGTGTGLVFDAIVGNTANLRSLAGTTNQITVTNGATTITLSTPQDIATTSSPTFVTETLTGLTATALVATTAGKVLQSVILAATSANGANSTLSFAGSTLTLVASNTQDLSTAGSPSFANITDTGLTASTAVIANAAKQLTSVALTDGQLVIGVTAGNPVAGAIAGTANQIAVALGAGTITLSTPQDIGTGSSPTFVTETLTGLTATALVATTAGKVLQSVTLAATSTNGINSTLSFAGSTLTLAASAVQDLSTAGSPTFVAETLTGLSATALVATNAGKTLQSVTLAATSANGANSTLSFAGSTLTLAASNVQDLSTAGSPSFANITDTGLTASTALIANASKQLTSVALTDGRLVIGVTAGNPVAGAITGTANQIAVALGAGTITLSTPQDIGTGSSPTFVTETLTGLTATALVSTNGAKVLQSVTLAASSANGANSTLSFAGSTLTLVASNTQNLSTAGSPTFVNATLSGGRLTLNNANAFIEDTGGTITTFQAEVGGTLQYDKTGDLWAFTANSSLVGGWGVAELVSLVRIRAGATSNQLLFDTTSGQRATINANSQVAAHTYNIIDAGADADFVMTQASQTITGMKRFSSGITFDGTYTLQDYATAITWTPGISFGGGTTGITYGSQFGKYSRIGNMVFLSLSLTLTSKGSSTGAAKLTGLPITSSGILQPTISMGGWGIIGLDTNYVNFAIAVNQAATDANLNQSANNSNAYINATDTNFSNTATIRAGFFYYV